MSKKKLQALIRLAKKKKENKFYNSHRQLYLLEEIIRNVVIYGVLSRFFNCIFIKCLNRNYNDLIKMKSYLVF